MLLDTTIANQACFFFFLLFVGLRPCRAISQETPWWAEPFGMLQTNLREIDADMNVDEVAEYIQNHGATAWLISVGGILANYPTKLNFQIENNISSQRPSGDLIQDALEVTRARKVRLLGRMDFSKVQPTVADAHPDWLYISPNGTWQNHTHGLVSVCPSGKWYQERVFDILEEVMANYELDGFFVNWAGYNERDYSRVYHGVCHCASCKTRWKEAYGSKALPDGPWSDTYNEWKVFSDGVIDEWTGRVRDFIAEKLPNAALILGESADIMFHEANNAVGREMWHFATSETVSKHKSHRPDVPVLVNAAAFLDLQYRFAAENSQNYFQYHLQAIARGANPSTYLIGTPGSIPWPGIEKVADLMQFHRRWKSVYTDLKPIAKTGLVLPRSSVITNETLYEEALSEYKGLYMAMQELHILFDVIAEENIPDMAESDGLSRYEAIVLPHLGTLPSETAKSLDNWVSDGGSLLFTGRVGLQSDNSTLQLESLPATRLNAPFVEDKDLWSTYFAPEQNRTQDNYYAGPIIPILGFYGEYEWKDGSQGLYKKLAFAPFAPPEYIYGNIQVDERGAGIKSFGNGTGTLIPFAVGRGYSEVGYDMFRDFLKLVLSKVGAREKLSFDIAPQVEITVNKNRQNQTLLHIINVSGVRHQNYVNIGSPWQGHYPPGN